MLDVLPDLVPPERLSSFLTSYSNLGVSLDHLEKPQTMSTETPSETQEIIFVGLPRKSKLQIVGGTDSSRPR